MLCKTHKIPMTEGKAYQIVDFSEEPPKQKTKKLFWCPECSRFYIEEITPKKPKRHFSVSLAEKPSPENAKLHITEETTSAKPVLARLY